jgi:hypothetical protein
MELVRRRLVGNESLLPGYVGKGYQSAELTPQDMLSNRPALTLAWTASSPCSVTKTARHR